MNVRRRWRVETLRDAEFERDSEREWGGEEGKVLLAVVDTRIDTEIKERQSKL